MRIYNPDCIMYATPHRTYAEYVEQNRWHALHGAVLFAAAQQESRIQIENTRLLLGLFKERADINRAYLMELKSENLLQNFLLEAGGSDRSRKSTLKTWRKTSTSDRHSISAQDPAGLVSQCPVCKKPSGIGDPGLGGGLISGVDREDDARKFLRCVQR